MAIIKITASGEDTARAEGSGDFVLPKPGLYHVKLTEVKPGYSKDGDGEEDKTRPYLECIYTIVGEGKEGTKPDANYGNLWDYVTFGGTAGWKRAQFVRAFYPDRVKPGEELNEEIDTDELIERVVMARIKHEAGRTKDDDKRAKIATLFPIGDDFAAATEGMEDAYGEAADDTPDPFASEPEPEEDGNGDGLLTAEELEEMTLKDLGAIAKEFDLDPTELIVRNRAKKVDEAKTKEAVIAAILEAQNGPAEGGDEDPF